MKVSDYLRQVQANKQLLPDVGEDSMLHFWGGWLIGRGARYRNSGFLSDPENIKQAIHVAEFIEAHALSGIAGLEETRIMSKEEVEKIWPRE